MFGKPRDIDDSDIIDPNAIDGFFGDEEAAETIVELHELQQRVEHVESQISSQFTSLATYAQIAQEQVEMARSEAKATTERSEQRVTSLIERERADRISSFTGHVPAGAAPTATPDTLARLDALEHSVAQIRTGLDECLLRQKALADAITTMFERLAPTDQRADIVETVDVLPAAEHREVDPVTAFAPPTLARPTLLAAVTPLSGPIADLSLQG